MISFIRLHKKKKTKNKKKTVNPAKTHDAFCPVTQASSSTTSGLDRIGSDWITDRIANRIISIHLLGFRFHGEVYFKLDVNVKVVEMGYASTLQLPCIP